MRSPAPRSLAFVLASLAACTSSGGQAPADGAGGPDATGGAGDRGGASGSSGGAAGGLGSGGQIGAGASGGSASGGQRGSGGTTGSGGRAPASTGGAAASSSGGATGQGSGGTSGGAGTSGSCASALGDRIRVTEVDVGVSYAYNEVDNNGANLGLTPLALSPLPGGGARLAFLGKGDGTVHIVTLDGDDHVTGTAVTLPAYDFQDLFADASGGVVLVSRDALGATANHNCGDINNLCGLVANYPTGASCYDMYLVRFDAAGESWATKLTETSATNPAYGAAATSGNNVIYIWSEYAHNGRIAFDGTNYAGYFGAAITVPNQGCVGTSTLATGVNIHQGDRMKLVNGSGALQAGGFDWGCSHSGYQRVVWDPATKAFIPVCKNDAATGDRSGRIAFAPSAKTIYPVDLSYAQLGSVALAARGGYWIATSDVRAGQPAGMNGLADVHLLHVPSTSTPTPDQDILLVSDGANDRAPHLAAYGAGQLLAAWESSSTAGDFSQTDSKRQLFVQVLDAATGAIPAGATTDAVGPVRVTPNVLGSRYQDFRAFPDGSVAYPAPGSGPTKIKILRVLGCQ